MKPVVSKFKIYKSLVSEFFLTHTQTSGGGATTEKTSPLLDLLVSKLKPRMVASGFSLFRAGSSPEEDGGVFFISKGTMALEDDEQGEKIFTVTEGEHFGYYSAMMGQRRTLTARAVSECQLFVLSMDNFASIVGQFPVFEELLVEICDFEDYFD